MSGARWDTVDALVTLLRERMPGVLVEPGFPGDRVAAPQMVWTEELDGMVDIPVTAGPGLRAHTNDVFEVPVICRVSGEADLTATMQAVIGLTSAVTDLLATVPDLGVDAVLKAATGQVRQTAQGTQQGPLGFGRVDIEVTVRET